MMSTKANDLFSIIENMPIDVKTALIEKMLASIHPLQKDVDEEWIEEVEERIREIKVGSIQLIPGDQVFKEVEDRYKR
jgi:hypothetical protein